VNRKFGLTAPLRRGSRDFEAASGAGLLGAKTKQVLLTEPGELPWRTSFGAGLGRLRHQNNDAVLRELARVAVRDAMARWMRGVRLLRLQSRSVDGALAVEVAVAETDTESTNVEAIL
jgi:phage baseplate assembly protein W